MPQNFLTCDRANRCSCRPTCGTGCRRSTSPWFVIEAIEELCLEPFYAAYRADGHGAAAHEPKMMLTLLAYAYAVGERSSRGIVRWRRPLRHIARAKRVAAIRARAWAV